VGVYFAFCKTNIVFCRTNILNTFHVVIILVKRILSGNLATVASSRCWSTKNAYYCRISWLHPSL